MTEPRPRTFGGKPLRCRGWRQEGLLRLLENVLAVGEDPEHLVVYAALGKAARNRPAYEAIVQALRTLDEDETMIVQSGKPIAILTTHSRAPLVLMANCNLVGRWANEEVFYDLEQRGLICWGGLTAGCWQYIGSQGVLQGTYEILARARPPVSGAADLAGRFFLTAGLGGMGSAQPRAASMLGAASITVEVDPERAAKRFEAGAVNEVTDSLPRALESVGRAMSERRAWAVALVANAADVYPAIAAGALRPDVVTDQTAAHDLLYGYVPQGYSPADVRRERERDPAKLTADGVRSIGVHVQAMLEFQKTRRHRVRQRQLDSQSGGARRRRPGLRHSGVHGGVSAAAVLRRNRPFPLDRALRGRADIRDDRRSFARRPSRTMRRSPAGSASRATRCRSRGCRRASRGSATARAPRSVSRSTTWYARTRSRDRSRSPAITSMPAPWLTRRS